MNTNFLSAISVTDCIVLTMLAMALISAAWIAIVLAIQLCRELLLSVGLYFGWVSIRDNKQERERKVEP